MIQGVGGGGCVGADVMPAAQPLGGGAVIRAWEVRPGGSAVGEDFAAHQFSALQSAFLFKKIQQKILEHTGRR